MNNIPHPKTRIYYPLHHQEILRDFKFPFIAKLPRASAQGRGVFLVRSEEGLKNYLSLTKVAYIQEYLPHNRDLRIILINYKPVIAYWRLCPPGGFKSNIYQGGTFDFHNIPEDAVHLAVEYAKRCRFNDVGLDMIKYNRKWYLIEANMKYGRKGLMKMGLEIKEIIREMLLSGEITGD